jgi:hypothetical protein
VQLLAQPDNDIVVNNINANFITNDLYSVLDPLHRQ